MTRYGFVEKKEIKVIEYNGEELTARQAALRLLKESLEVQASELGAKYAWLDQANEIEREAILYYVNKIKANLGTSLKKFQDNLH